MIEIELNVCDKDDPGHYAVRTTINKNKFNKRKTFEYIIMVYYLYGANKT